MRYIMMSEWLFQLVAGTGCSVRSRTTCLSCWSTNAAAWARLMVSPLAVSVPVACPLATAPAAGALAAGGFAAGACAIVVEEPSARISAMETQHTPRWVFMPER
jgi:hypothetical protein